MDDAFRLHALSRLRQTRQPTTQNLWTLTSLLDTNDYFSPHKGNATIFAVSSQWQEEREYMSMWRLQGRTKYSFFLLRCCWLWSERMALKGQRNEGMPGDSLKNHYNRINFLVHWRKTATFFFLLINPIFQAQMSNVLFCNNLLCLLCFIWL